MLVVVANVEDIVDFTVDCVFNKRSVYDDDEDAPEDCSDLIITDADVLVAWDIDREDEAGAIPGEVFETLISKLKTVMKGKKKARND